MFGAEPSNREQFRFGTGDSHVGPDEQMTTDIADELGREPALREVPDVLPPFEDVAVPAGDDRLQRHVR